MGHVGSPPAYENQQTQKPQQSAETPVPAPPQQVHQQVPQQHQPQQAPMAQQYAQQPMQQQAHTGPYPIPLGSLGDQAAWVNCPSCHAVQMTRVEYVAGTTTHLWALALCCCLCLGCIPYCVSSMKDAEHHCGQCGALLATYKRGSGTQVNAGAISGQPMPPQQVQKQ